jgi:hypothetical protein
MENVNDNGESSRTQCSMILEWLKAGNTITSLEALRMFGCMRLASRICDLRDRGVSIKTEKIQVKSGKWVTRYSLGEHE